MRTTCCNDGWEMLPTRVQVLKPVCEVRVWLTCPKCKNTVVNTYTYPVGEKDIEVQIID
jgi:hypothetical protein